MKRSVRPEVFRHRYFVLLLLHLQPAVDRQPSHRREDFAWYQNRSLVAFSFFIFISLLSVIFKRKQSYVQSLLQTFCWGLAGIISFH